MDRKEVALPGHCCLDGLEFRRSSDGGVGEEGVIDGSFLCEEDIVDDEDV